MVSVSSSWIPPLHGSLKLNADAAIRDGVGVVRLGGVIRDSNGVVLACWAKSIPGNFNVTNGELLAI